MINGIKFLLNNNLINYDNSINFLIKSGGGTGPVKPSNR